MTEDISNFIFDFEAEVSRLRGEFSEHERGKILFVDVKVSRRLFKRSQGKARVKALIADDATKKIMLRPTRRNIDETYRKEPFYGSYSQAFTNEFNFISLKRKDYLETSFRQEDQPIMKLFTLYHETGHALLPDNPDIDETEAYGECAADAYAALQMLRRFGPAAVPLLSQLSWRRACEVVVGDADHVGTVVLDKIIADSAAEDFSALTHDQLVDRARSYAESGTPDTGVLKEAIKILDGGGIDKAGYEHIAQTCLASPNKFAFYIGAKMFQPLLRPEGILVPAVGTYKIPDEKRPEYSALIAERAEGMTLNDIFSRAVDPDALAPPVAETLEVILPQGQKQFVFNP